MFLCRNAGDWPKRRAPWSQYHYSRKFLEAHPRANGSGRNLRVPRALARPAKLPLARQRLSWWLRRHSNRRGPETMRTADRTKRTRNDLAGGNKFHRRASWVRRPNRKADNSTELRWRDGAGCNCWREGRALRRRKRICSLRWRNTGV